MTTGFSGGTTRRKAGIRGRRITAGVSQIQAGVVLADFAPTADGVPAIDPTDLLRGLRAATGVGAALLASEVLREWVDAMRDRRVEAAGSRLGVDLATVEGRLAATAYALVQEGIVSGTYPVLPRRPDMGRIGAEAAALYELLHPGTILQTGMGGDPAKQRALQDFIAAAGDAYEQGRLRLQACELAEGWVEVFPELTEGERRLGELPGFTPERIAQWLETYPAEDLGLPDHTGAPVPAEADFDALVDRKSEMERAMFELPNADIRDAALKLLAYTDGGRDFAEDGYGTGFRLLREMGETIGGTA